MRAHQFFRKVWRVDALLILLVGILGVGHATQIIGHPGLTQECIDQ